MCESSLSVSELTHLGRATPPSGPCPRLRPVGAGKASQSERMPNPAVPRVCQDAHKQPRWERRGETNETADLEIYVRSRRTETLKKLAKRIYTPAVGGSIPSAPTAAFMLPLECDHRRGRRCPVVWRDTSTGRRGAGVPPRCARSPTSPRRRSRRAGRSSVRRST